MAKYSFRGNAECCQKIVNAKLVVTELSVNATTCAHHQCNCCRRVVPTHSTCTMHMLPMMLPKVSGLIHDTSRPVCAMSKVCSIPFICQLKQACMAHIYIMYSISYRIHHGYCYKCYVCFLKRILPTQCCSRIIPGIHCPVSMK